MARDSGAPAVDAGDAGDAGTAEVGVEDAGGHAADAGSDDAGAGDVGDTGGGVEGDAGDGGADAGDGAEPVGTISGSCGEIDGVEIGSPDPYFFRNVIDFGAAGFEEPGDLPRLSAGGQEVFRDGNAGGSSLWSEVFAYEVLYRCEMATLLKTETEVDYTTPGKITDLLVEVEGIRVGVSVTRAVSFPRSSEYPLSQAQGLLEGKLSDILESSANVAPADAWPKQILHVLADEVRHADALEAAWGQIDASIRADTIIVVTISEGVDDFIY